MKVVSMEEGVLDRIFSGRLEDLPPYGDGTEHPDGARLSPDQGVLQGQARPRVPGQGEGAVCVCFFAPEAYNRGPVSPLKPSL